MVRAYFLAVKYPQKNIEEWQKNILETLSLRLVIEINYYWV